MPEEQIQFDIETAVVNNQNNTESTGENVAKKPIKVKRRATAEAMSAAQKEISVSEFFAKNRHLLGFDNPRKALLTTVKEAVDNSLDACEEAGILPEIWVAIESTGNSHYKVSIQDNGPGIVKKQIPLIFGKLLYGSKFHRLRMSRGQQGIGISAAGMYGLLTTGKPVRVMSKTSPRKPVHYYAIRMNTKNNQPDILNGGGEGEDIPPNDDGRKMIEKQGLVWVEVEHGTRVAIELEAKYQRGRGSVDEYLEQTAISNPHVTIHYRDPEGLEKHYEAAVAVLPPEPQEIKPHPYGVEFGRLIHMLHDTPETTLGKFFTESFSRVSPSIAKTLSETAGLGVRSIPQKLARPEVEKLYQAIQDTKIPPPSTDCIAPIGESLLLQGLHKVVPGEFFTATTRPPSVYRGNPFQIEVGLAYGGAAPTYRVSRETLEEALGESDARTLRQFLTVTFDSINADAADKFIKAAKLRPRVSPGNLSEKEIAALHETLQTVSISEGQTMNVYRYANRVPLQFQAGACLITQTVMGMNWKSYGLPQARNQLPRGPATVMVHVASVWVPFTSESKEAIAAYPEIQKELRLALQAVGRKLGTYLRRRERVKQEGERRNIFLRYLGEVATAVTNINSGNRGELYEKLMEVAKLRTSMADVKLGEDGKPVEEEELDLGENVIIVNREEK
ncbi:MAG: DNA topoisomerase VI subunit B [Planctomycetaceae bacterium]|jgi:DNA topoisomerase-6 subunit B|nr:DNA topoisomerase VI subunit B [Planctomycetaceae bacterium]